MWELLTMTLGYLLEAKFVVAAMCLSSAVLRFARLLCGRPAPGRRIAAVATRAARILSLTCPLPRSADVASWQTAVRSRAADLEDG